MFAHTLNEEEKGKFLELVYKVALCDEDYADDEQEIITNYKAELGLTEIPETAEVEDLILYFAAKPEKTKKIVYFEVYRMVMADSVVAEAEGVILNQIKIDFDLSAEEYTEIDTAADDLQNARDRVYDAVFG